MFGKKNNTRRRGVVAVQVVVALPVLMGFAAMSVDVGVMYNARSEMQRAADSAALAAVADIAYSQEDVAPTTLATGTAVNYVNINPVLGQSVQLDTQSDVVFGRAYYDDVNNAYNFVGGDTPINAARVTVRQTEGSPSGQLPLYFAAIFGKAATNLQADATAIFVNTNTVQSECGEDVPAGLTMMCLYGDSDDSDDSQGEFGPPDSDDSDDSDTGDSDGDHNGDPDDSDDSEAGDSDDSDDSQGTGEDSDSDSDSCDSESGDSSADSDGPFTTLVDSTAVPIFLSKGGELGSCDCINGDSDDSDDSQGEFGPPDSVDSDDSDTGDSDGSTNGDSDDSDDSQGEFGPPDSDDSDDSDTGDSDGSTNGDPDDSDDSQGEFGPADSDDSDDSDGGDSDSGNNGNNGNNGNGQVKVTICHIPPGNPDNPQTITIGQPAVNAHLAHGDTLGFCEDDLNINIFLIE